MPKISVLVPVYNVKAYLKQCIDSICNQTFQEFEIICIDDGSTDGSEIMLDEFADQDERIRVIHKKNSGYGKSMNLGLEQARGTYVAIVESDDFVEKDMLEKLYQAAERSNADITRGRYYRYYEGKNQLGGLYEGIPTEQKITIHTCPSLFRIAETIWTGLYRRSYLEKNHIRFHETDGASFQDISFALQCWLHCGTAYFIDDAVIHYRIDNPNSSMKNPAKIFCVFDEYAWIEEMFADFLETQPELDKYFVAMKYRDYLNHYFRVGEQYQYALLLRLHEKLQEDKQRNRIKEDAFIPSVWSNLKAINENKNSFFVKTQKNKKDDRLAYCDVVNASIYRNALIHQLKTYEGIIIYGAGVIGKKTLQFLLKQECKNISFAVTKQDDSEVQYMGYPIYSIDQLVDKKDEYVVILAVSEEKQYDMYQNLQRFGFSQICRVDEAIRKMINE